MKKKKLFIIIMIVFVVIGALIAGMASFMLGGLQDNEALAINNVSATGLADGTYIGEYGKGRWSNRIAVSAEDGIIYDIKVQDTVTFERADITQKLIEAVIASQSTDVDCISGATATCKSYLKSIENALTQIEKEQN